MEVAYWGAANVLAASLPAEVRRETWYTYEGLLLDFEVEMKSDFISIELIANAYCGWKQHKHMHYNKK